ncbi:tetratricopeptide repeat protein [bacterium]|nr:tetratricopeptide repeat protein [bacterium]
MKAEEIGDLQNANSTCKFFSMFFYFFFFFVSSAIFSAQSAINLMQEATKFRFSGNLQSAISNLRNAAQIATKPIQKNLARLMLGDCLIEAKSHREAITIYQELLSAPNLNEEEESEACFRIAQCYKVLKEENNMRTKCQELLLKYPDGPYAELAKSLIYPKFDRTSVPIREDCSPSKNTVHIQPVPALTEPKTKSQIQYESGASKNPQTNFSSDVSKNNRKVIFSTKNESLKGDKGEEPEKFDVTNSSSDAFNSPADAVTKRLLTIGKVNQARREILTMEILRLQEQQKKAPGGIPGDKLLFSLASKTAAFGEIMEACRLYDTILTKYPNSKYVETSYFEAIRLRAILRMFPAVLRWGEVFMKTFPKSTYLNPLKSLMKYAEKAKTLPSRRASGKPIKASEKETKNAGNENQLAKDPLFILSSRYVSSGKFELATSGFKALSKRFPRSPRVWWELALVQIQQKHNGDAEKSLQTLLALDPKNGEANSLLGYIHYQRKEFQKAANAYINAGPTAKKGLAFFDPEYAAKKMQDSQKSGAKKP